MAAAAKKSSAGLIALAWLLVGLPFSWGIYKSGLNVVKLFNPPPAAAAAPATPAK
jgi:hypothetical protein